MPRKLSHIAPDWWDYTTLDSKLINDAAKLSERDHPDGILAFLGKQPKPWLRGLLSVVCAAIPIAVVLTLAVQNYLHEATPVTPNPTETPGPQEPSNQDYEDYRK